MAYGFTYDGIHSSSKGIIVTSVQRDILPKITSRTITIPGRPGAYYTDSEYDMRQIRVEIVFLEKSLTDIRTKVRDIAAWLKPEVLKPLVFDDEPDKTYLAVLSEGSEIEEIVYTGKGEITFICPDPYAFGSEYNQVIEAPNPTFTRSSVAYLSDGTQVAANTPRFEQGKFGQAVMVEEGTTNLLTVNQSSVETDTTGFVTLNSTISRDTVEHWVGGASLKCVTSNISAFEGFYLDAAITGGSTYTASVYVKGSGVIRLLLAARDATKQLSFVDSGDVTLTSSWQRIAVTHTMDATATTARIIVRTNIQQSITWYTDGLQLEQKPYSTSWTLGGSTRSPETLTIPAAGVLNPQEGTVECLVYVNDIIKRTDGVYRVIWYALPVGGLANGWLVLDHSDNSANWRIAVSNGSASAIYLISDSYTPNGWHLFSLTYNKSDGSIRLLIDGVLRFSTTRAPLPSSYDKMFVGLAPEGIRHCNTLIDDLRISSRARTDTEIAAAYQSNAPLTADAGTTYLLHLDGTLAVTNDTTVTNSGTYKTYPVVTVKFSAAASEYKITGPNGDYVRVVKSFAAGDELVIDFDKHYVTLNGVSAMPYLDWENSKFFELQPGDNILTCTPDNVALVTTTWKPRWL